METQFRASGSVRAETVRAASRDKILPPDWNLLVLLRTFRKCARSALRTRLPDGKHIRSSVPALPTRLPNGKHPRDASAWIAVEEPSGH